MEAVDLGQLKGIILSKTGSDDWIVEYVEMDCPNGVVEVFEIGKSIPKDGIKIRKSIDSLHWKTSL